MAVDAAPGDVLQRLPDAGVIRIGHAVTQHGRELRSDVFGRVTTGGKGGKGVIDVVHRSRRYHPVVGDRVLGVVRGARGEDPSLARPAGCCSTQHAQQHAAAKCRATDPAECATSRPSERDGARNVDVAQVSRQSAHRVRRRPAERKSRANVRAQGGRQRSTASRSRHPRPRRCRCCRSRTRQKRTGRSSSTAPSFSRPSRNAAATWMRSSRASTRVARRVTSGP